MRLKQSMRCLQTTKGKMRAEFSETPRTGRVAPAMKCVRSGEMVRSRIPTRCSWLNFWRKQTKKKKGRRTPSKLNIRGARRSGRFLLYSLNDIKRGASGAYRRNRSRDGRGG